jgi:hypothetical protein
MALALMGLNYTGSPLLLFPNVTKTGEYFPVSLLTLKGMHWLMTEYLH